MTKFVKVALWNANGLLHHKDEIKIFLDHNAVDILLVSETHFTERSYFKIPHYNTYFTNHPDNTTHAGAGIIIKNTIFNIMNYLNLKKTFYKSLQLK
jgi:exonuclease III